MFKEVQAVLVFLITFIGYSYSLNQTRVLPLVQPIAVKTNKSTPAYQAFSLLHPSQEQNLKSGENEVVENLCSSGCRDVNLNDLKSDQQSLRRPEKLIMLSKTFILKKDFISEDAPKVYQPPPARILASQAKSDVIRVNEVREVRNEIMAVLTPQQQVRIEKAQSNGFNLDEAILPTQDFAAPSRIYAHAGPNRETATDQAPKEAARTSTVYSPSNPSSEAPPDLASRRDDGSSATPDTENSSTLLSGRILFSNGLAYTDTTHLVIGRSEDGQLKDQGKFHLQDASYQIHVQNRTGTLVAKLYSGTGQLLGEGSQRLNSLEWKPNQKNGPEIVLTPVQSFAGRSASHYDVDEGGDVKPTAVRGASPPLGLQGNLASGFAELKMDEENQWSLDGIQKNSFAVLRTQGKTFFQTNQIVASNEKVLNLIYPVGMMEALKEIVAEQRSSEEFFHTLGRVKNEDLAVIWGQVMIDKKPVAQAEVTLEGSEDLVPIYFNDFQLPDQKLKSTSRNGYFAFLAPREGLQSLVARKGLKYIAHSNVYVEKGAVAFADMKNSSAIEPVTVKSFDAFTGEARAVNAQIQSLDYTVEIPEGYATVFFPTINRLGFAQVQAPESYVPALYAYNDNVDHLHFPLLTYQWLNQKSHEIQNKHGTFTSSERGTIVGFVMDEEFVVQTWGAAQDEHTRIVYFDAQGNLLDQNTGIAGGGFMIVNHVGDEVQLSVDFLQSQTTSLRVLPSGAQTVSVLTVKAEGL